MSYLDLVKTLPSLFGVVKDQVSSQVQVHQANKNDEEKIRTYLLNVGLPYSNIRFSTNEISESVKIDSDVVHSILLKLFKEKKVVYSDTNHISYDSLSLAVNPDLYIKEPYGLRQSLKAWWYVRQILQILSSVDGRNKTFEVERYISDKRLGSLSENETAFALGICQKTNLLRYLPMLGEKDIFCFNTTVLDWKAKQPWLVRKILEVGNG